MWILGESGNDDGLARLKGNWAKLWPVVKRNLKRMLKRVERDFDPPVRLKKCKWTAEGGRLEPDVFMSDKADLFLRIRLEECPAPEDDLPVWDFFINGIGIIHCQPVY